jgi:predicted ATPase
VHWFPIGTLNDPSTVLSALAGALGVRGSPKATVEEIIDHLCPLSTLLVIDNAEHHLTTCAELCRAILAGAPKLTILVTSRHLTGVPGEQAFPVVPLQLPAPGTPASQLSSIPSCQLFPWPIVDQQSTRSGPLRTRSSGFVSGLTASRWLSS